MNRKLLDFGIPPALAYPLIFIFFFALVYYLDNRFEYAPWILFIAGVYALTISSDKPRNEFLKNIFFQTRFRYIRFVENLFLVFPFCLALVLFGHFLHSTALLIIAVASVFIQIDQLVKRTIPTPFGRLPFELPVGFRKSWFILVAIYLVFLKSWQVENFNLGLFTLFICLLTCSTYFSSPERLFFVWMYNRPPGQFLFEKGKIATQGALILTLPIFLSLIIIYPSRWWITCGVMVSGILFTWSMIVAKYTSFPMDVKLIYAIALAISLWFPPLLLLLVPHLYIEAKKNLQYILE